MSDQRDTRYPSHPPVPEVKTHPPVPATSAQAPDTGVQALVKAVKALQAKGKVSGGVITQAEVNALAIHADAVGMADAIGAEPKPKNP